MAKSEKPKEPKEVRVPKPQKKPTKPKKTKNELLWEDQARLLKRRIRAAQKKGYEVELELIKPVQIRKRDIEQLKNIKRAKIIKGVDLKQVKVKPGLPEGMKKPEPGKEISRENAAPAGPKGREESISAQLPEKEPQSEGAGPLPEELEPEPEPEPEGPKKYFDTESGKILDEGDPQLYVRDNEGNIIFDLNGKPIIKDKYAPISPEPMPEIDFDQQLMDMMRERYAENIGISSGSDTYWSAKNEAVVNFIDKLIEKYGASELRRAFEEAADQGFEINQNFLYHATAEDVAFMLTRIAGLLGQEAIDDIQPILEQLMAWGEENEDWEDVE